MGTSIWTRDFLCRLVEDRRYEELKADFKASQSTHFLSIPVEILKHASEIYTHEVFNMFHVEVCKAYDSQVDIFKDDGIIMKYLVVHQKKKHQYSVVYDSKKSTLICSCKRFEFVGILCSHTLRVL